MKDTEVEGSETGLRQMVVCAHAFAEAGEWHQLGWHERPGNRLAAAQFISEQG